MAKIWMGANTDMGNKARTKVRNQATGAKFEGGRKACGAVLIEGAIGLILVIIGSLLGGVLMSDAALAAYYKQRIGYAANQAAIQAARSYVSWNFYEDYTITDAKLTSEATVVANHALKALGLPKAKSLKLTRTAQSIRHDLAVYVVEVTLQVDGLNLLGLGSILPSGLSIKDTATAVAQNNVPPAGLGLSLEGNPHAAQVSVPVYGKFHPAYSGGPYILAPVGVVKLRTLTRPWADFGLSMPAGFTETLKHY